MRTSQDEREDRYLAPGTRVSLDPAFGDGQVERGIVVHCWFDEEIASFDCYVAFFGAAIPVGRPVEQPYVLRYAAISLTPEP
jgi:hypothetical protein